jgi:hypothetical protein
MQFLKILSVLFAFTSSAIAANTAGVYVGTLGKSAIVLKLEEASGTQTYGSYYYRNHARDINLNGSIKNSSLRLEEFEILSTDPKAILELKIQGSNLMGAWTDFKNKKKTFPVNLHRVTSKDFAGIKLPRTPMLTKWKLENPYDYLRFDAALKTVKTETVNGKKVQWLLEPKSNVIFLRLAGQNKAVNDALIDEHYRVASEGLGCINNAPESFTYTPKISLYSKKILSVSAGVYYDCGGAHPDGGAENFNLNLSNGKTLELEDVYHFVPIPKGVSLDPNDTSDLRSKYLEARGAVLKTLILNHYKAFSSQKDCVDVYETDTLSYISWYLTNKSLVITPSFAHVVAACEDDFELPYKSLMQYLAPNSPLK